MAETELGLCLDDVRRAARRALDAEAFGYLEGGADDQRSLGRNEAAFAAWGIRCRRLVDVTRVDTSIELFGARHETPVLLAPVGYQRLFHEDADLATARAASACGHTLIVSSVSSVAVGDVARAAGRPVWFQLYPTTDRAVTRLLLERAEAAGCPVLVLTVDTPVFGNRQTHGALLDRMLHSGEMQRANYAGAPPFDTAIDPSMTWDMVAWLREHCGMRIVLKGIVTHEDAALAVEHGADGVIVSNHGGRQEESDLGTVECLPEVVDAVAGRIPVLLDGGIRRGTDVFKALALGADAVCIGRPFAWGLAAAGQAGVEHVLRVLRAEFERTLRLAGRPVARHVGRDAVRATPPLPATRPSA